MTPCPPVSACDTEMLIRRSLPTFVANAAASSHRSSHDLNVLLNSMCRTRTLHPNPVRLCDSPRRALGSLFAMPFPARGRPYSRMLPTDLAVKIRAYQAECRRELDQFSQAVASPPGFVPAGRDAGTRCAARLRPGAGRIRLNELKEDSSPPAVNVGSGTSGAPAPSSLWTANAARFAAIIASIARVFASFAARNPSRASPGVVQSDASALPVRAAGRVQPVVRFRALLSARATR
jgi:hypothetical protein